MLHTWSCSEAVTDSNTGTAKCLRHGMHLKLLLRLQLYQVKVLHFSITIGFLSKVLIVVNICVSNQSMYTQATSSLEPLLWLQLAV